jgi:hypothetical protein
MAGRGKRDGASEKREVQKSKMQGKSPVLLKLSEKGHSLLVCFNF